MAFYEDIPERPLDPPELEEPENLMDETCQECGELLRGFYNVEFCTEHLDGQELIDYAANLKECFDKLVLENSSLNRKIDGGVETVKEQNSQIEALKSTVNELQETIKTLIDNANQFLADSLGIRKEKL